MRYKDREGNLIERETGQDKFLKGLYTKPIGRLFVRILITKPVTSVCGFFLNRRISSLFIGRFVKNNNIDMSQYEERKYKSYNDFFTRRIKEGKRQINFSEDVLISPSDGNATAVPISEKTVLSIKNTEYTLGELLRDDELAQEFRGGTCFIIRLAVDNYHRYCYVCSGKKSKNIHIKGVLHTVNPVAAEHAPIYKENSREYTVIQSEKFGKVLQMEVGALVVGKISNYHTGECSVEKGCEKGMFEFGGSTIIVLTQKDKITASPDIVANSGEDCETIVKMGEKIGTIK